MRSYAVGAFAQNICARVRPGCRWSGGPPDEASDAARQVYSGELVYLMSLVYGQISRSRRDRIGVGRRIPRVRLLLGGIFFVSTQA